MKVYQSPYPPVEKFDKRGVFSFIFEDNPKWKDSDIALIDANTNVEVSSGDGTTAVVVEAADEDGISLTHFPDSYLRFFLLDDLPPAC